VAKILLIDDDADRSHFLREVLEGYGHTVKCLDRAEQGPDFLANSRFDLVLLDNKMPGMTGIEFHRRRGYAGHSHDRVFDRRHGHPGDEPGGVRLHMSVLVSNEATKAETQGDRMDERAEADPCTTPPIPDRAPIHPSTSLARRSRQPGSRDPIAGM
jgi:Response regulator receiver domain